MVPEDSRHREIKCSEAPAKQERPASHDNVLEWKELARVASVAIAAAAVWFRWYEAFPSFSVVGVLATLIGGWPPLPRSHTKNRRPPGETDQSLPRLYCIAESDK